MIQMITEEKNTNVTIYTEHEVNRKATSLKVGIPYLSCLATHTHKKREKENIEIKVANNYNTYLEWSIFTITQDKNIFTKTYFV